MSQQTLMESSAQSVTLIAAGDIMLVLGMVPLLRQYGAEYPFRRVRSLLRQADAVFANLEAPFTARNTPTPYKSAESVRARRDYILRADPDSAIGLQFAGISALSLANNHMMDYQRGGLEDTLAVLGRLGIAHAGAGRNLREARRPAILQRKGLRLAVLSYSCILPVGSVATPTGAGIAPARGLGAEEAMQEDIAAARRASDFVLVSVHWGEQLARHPNRTQKRLGRLCLEWGADAVVGHHPHVLQGIEVHDGRVIAYSLGDFVNLSSRRETAALQLTIDRPHRIAAAKVIPLELRLGQPRVAEGAMRRHIVGQIRLLSALWDTHIHSDGKIRLSATSAG
jgi:poly-gamma-glutamate capsule biosynthesis protein CapA/YwtB (metallophosphatase superfamily)